MILRNELRQAISLCLSMYFLCAATTALTSESPEDHLPTHIKRLTAFGERADWSPDGRKIIFLSKTFGDVMEFDLATKAIRNLTAHYRHYGYTRALYLANGDILLSGPETYDPKRSNDARTQCWLYVLDKSGIRPPWPLGTKCSEGPAVSRKRMHIAWTHVAAQYPEQMPAGSSRMQEADIVFEGGKPKLAQQRTILDSGDLPFSCTLETQNFRPPLEKELTFSAYGFQGTDVCGIDLETKKVVNYSNSPGQYDEPEGVFPDGEHALVECDKQNHKGPGHVDLWKLKLDGSGHYERLTYFSDYDGYKASNPVVSDDGRFIAFQLAKATEDAGVGHGIFVYETEKNESSLRLIPFPKEIKLKPGLFSLKTPLVLELSEDQSAVWLPLLNAELKAAGLEPALSRPLASPSPAFRLASTAGELKLPSLPKPEETESYTLDVRENEIVCAASSPAGLIHGLQTLRQLIRANRQGDALPCLSIRDWPSLRWRCFQDDMTRGPSSTLDTLKFEAGLGAFLKLNLMTYYMEHQFAFKKHPKIGPTGGSLTPEDLSALINFAKPLHLDILGNQQSFGHFGRILKHPEYSSLRETDDVLTPVREETYQLLDDLYSEICPILPFPWFNVCCDETDGLGNGPAKELSAKIGVGGVYVQHIRRVHDLLRDKHHKRMMMWGDIILQHPDKLERIPKDTIMLTWGYDARPSFEDQIVPFAKSGYEFFVCPGVNNWSRILPDFGAAVTNIHNFIRDGAKHSAIGMLNTDWEDDGEAVNAVKWHADAWAAECAWNASATSFEAFNRRAGAVLFGEKGGHFGEAVALLMQTHRLPGMNGMMNARFWEQDFAPAKNPAVIHKTASNLLALVRPAIRHLEACRQEARANSQVLDAILFGARRMEFIGQRMLDGLKATQLYAQAVQASNPVELLSQIEALVRQTRDSYDVLGKEFETLWLSESKPYGLDWTRQKYANAIKTQNALLARIASARSDASAGKPLPDPEVIGLALPRPVSRAIRPHESDAAVLQPESIWSDTSATHRLGLTIRAGALDRYDLPVELELALPGELAAKPVRTFLMNSTEIPVQIDSLSFPGKYRLVLLLPGPLLASTEAVIQVYLGLSQKPSPLPQSVTTSPGSNEMVWIENNRVRLLWGPEGAHCYRWEVKAANNRDLTMPGETGWAGFSDIGFKRQSRYRLNCTARGPAMVEYQFTDADDHAKTIRLYAGASWIEVFLNEPTSLYWDFDNPKNFAADGPSPGTWLFSNGKTGLVGRESEGVPAQVKMANCFWAVKYNSEKLALGMATPGSASFQLIAPGGGAGGVGIENPPPAAHFATFAGILDAPPADTMNRLQSTLDLKRPVEIKLHAIQKRVQNN